MADHYHVFEVQRDLLERRQLVRSYSLHRRGPAIARARLVLSSSYSVLIEPCDRPLAPGQQPHDCPATMADRAF
jgi:hypothetical protein